MTLWSDFHFLRPFWLLLLAIAVLVFFLPRRAGAHSAWEKAIDPHLLPHLMLGSKKSSSSIGTILLSLFFALLALALAGPTVKKIPTDVGFNKAPLIICLELSDHMLSKDINPTRLERATHKLQDLLALYQGAEVALIAYAGDAHVVVPLSDDYNTILTLAKSLTPDLMPIKGTNLTSALTLAKRMSDRNPKSQILVITSSHMEEDHNALSDIIRRLESPVMVWTFATEIGAPLQSSDGRFKGKGEVKISKREADDLMKLAGAGAVLINFSPDARDVNSIVSRVNNAEKVLSQRELYFDTWYDLGPYFLALAMVVFLMASFLVKDRWWLLGLLLVVPTHPVKAGVGDWFLRKDQQAHAALERGEPQKAAELFDDNFSKGSAYYRAKMYDQAINHLKNVNTSDGQYNLGNAYAHKGQVSEAINAYEQALKLNPDNEDAKANKELLEKQQKQQQQKSDQPNQPQEKNQSEKNQDQSQGEPSPNNDSQNQEKRETPPTKSQNESQQQQPSQNERPREEMKKQEAAGAPKDDNSEKKATQQEQPIKPEPKGQQGTPDPETRYYFDQMKQNNNLYFKRKFLYESQKHKEAQ